MRGWVGGVRCVPLLHGSTVANNTLLCINTYFSSAAAVHTVILYMGEWVGGWMGT